MATLYKATNTQNGKCYIGFTSKTLDWRRKCHQYQSTKAQTSRQPKFHYALRKHKQHFVWEVLEEHDDAEWLLRVREPELIALYDSVRLGYNCSPGGEKPAGNRGAAVHNYDHNIRVWYHASGAVFHGTRGEFMQKYNIPRTSLNKMVRTDTQRLNSCKGWSLSPNGGKYVAQAIITNGKQEYTGTANELGRLINITPDNMSHLLAGRSKSVKKGEWKLKRLLSSNEIYLGFQSDSPQGC